MMNREINIEADILSLGHHGSNTSTDPAFLKAVNPEIAIYSAGTSNSYGHPHPEVVSRVQDAGITLYGTDVHGTILDRKSTRLNSSHVAISYAVFCLKK